YSPPGRGLLQYSERWPSYPAGPTPCRSVAPGAIEPSGYSELPAVFAPGAEAPTLLRAMTEPRGGPPALEARRPRREGAFRPLRAAGSIRPRGGGSHNTRCDNQTTRLAPPPVGASPPARLNLPATPSCRQYSPPGRGLPHYSER